MAMITRWIGLLLAILLSLSALSIITPGRTRADDGKPKPVTFVKKVDQNTTRYIDRNGREIDVVFIPGSPPPPGHRDLAAAVPAPNFGAENNNLGNVPCYSWCYGCSVTAAAMLCGYYDQPARGYTSIYTGPANGGVCPLNNRSAWGSDIRYPAACDQAVSCGLCPLATTKQGLDGREARGNVEDYWHAYLCQDDPYYDNWTAHADDCLGDYMGTSQWHKYNAPDGGTYFMIGSDNTPEYDPADLTFGDGSFIRDGCHGIKLFLQSRGYPVTSNYNQLIYGHGGISSGFTYAQYKAEIDAGRPVIIQLSSHSMLGVGYSDPDTVYANNTWGVGGPITFTWGGSYSGMQHQGVTVVHLESPLGIVTSSLPSGQAGTTYSETLQASGGTENYTWSVISGLLPTGLTLDGSSGNITGTPTSAATFNFIVQVNDGQSSVQKQLSILIQSSPAPSTSTNPADNITTNSATLNGNLTSLGSSSSVDVSFEWGTVAGSPYPNQTPAQARTATGTFSAVITGLTPGTPYYFRARADGGTNGISYGSEVSLSSGIQALLIAVPRYVYTTDNNTVGNTSLFWQQGWGLTFINNALISTIPNVTLIADTTNVGPITGTPFPPTSQTGPSYAWSWSNVLPSNSAAPLDSPNATKKAILTENRSVSLLTGFSCTRQVDKELFSTADNQTVTVTVTPYQQSDQRETIQPYLESMLQTGETNVARWQIIGPVSMLTNQPTPNQTYTYTFRVQVTPKVPGVIRHIPALGIVYISMHPLAGGPGNSRIVQVQDDIGRILPATAITSDVIQDFVSLTGIFKTVNFIQVSKQQSQLPSVATDNASGIGMTFATLNGTLTIDGGEDCQYRFCRGTASGVYTDNTTWSSGSKTTGQPFSENVTALVKGTQYYYVAECKNSAGTGRGAARSFTTSSIPTNTGVYGFVGVGTENPQRILHVTGTGPGTVPFFQRGTDSAGFIIERTPTNRWVLGVNESPALGNGFVLSTYPVGAGSSTQRLLVGLNGAVNIPGTLSKGGGSFKIDHPLDPENKYLQHSFVESPDMLNVYAGNAILDNKGEAVVQLAAYFQALNRDFSYQLDCVGGFAPVYVSKEIAGNSFSIAGGKPGMKVSWQVTGIRQDPFAKAHPVVVEQEKPAGEKGFYMHTLK